MLGVGRTWKCPLACWVGWWVWDKGLLALLGVGMRCMHVLVVVESGGGLGSVVVVGEEVVAV